MIRIIIALILSALYVGTVQAKGGGGGGHASGGHSSGGHSARANMARPSSSSSSGFHFWPFWGHGSSSCSEERKAKGECK